ncbi:MAG TPA: DUF882 domain-containing protein [Vicinamibacterales bacterium]|nr:DUF882 domain-containing protein [Vicinamibacterales bacterium]
MERRGTERRGEMRPGFDRRSFLSYGAVAAAAALAPMSAGASALGTAVVSKAPVRTLSFFHTHTGERARITYCCDGQYDPQALRTVNHLLRDFRVNKETDIDPTLLDLLHELGGTLESDQPFHIISGYRAPETNVMLRERGGTHTGVASKSLHMVGKAIDIRVPGVKLDNLRAAAKSLKVGGVGYYPSSNFVHVDTGRVRTW